jgi:hypothetical protein
MTHLLSLLFSLPLALVAGTVLLLAASLEPHPLVTAGPNPGHRDLERVRQLLRGQDPRTLPPGTDATLQIGESDLNLAVNYLLGLRTGADAHIELRPGTLYALATWTLPKNPVDRYLNMALEMRADDGRPRLTQLRLGRLELPLELDARQLGALLSRLFPREEIPLIGSELRSLRFQRARLVLVYRRDPDLLKQASSLAMSAGERETVALYRRRLAGILARRPATLDALLSPLFRLARERSLGAAAVAENRALLIALGLYALGRDAQTLAAGAAGATGGPWVTLQGRQDLARHYLVSAAVAAASNSGTSDMIGLYKEWDDSRGGSGFSFVDLAADRAGTRLGASATASERLARQLQDALSDGLADGALLPPVQDLPEGLQERHLQRGFGGIGAPRYQRMTATIERRLDAMPLYRQR